MSIELVTNDEYKVTPKEQAMAANRHAWIEDMALIRQLIASNEKILDMNLQLLGWVCVSKQAFTADDFDFSEAAIKGEMK